MDSTIKHQNNGCDNQIHFQMEKQSFTSPKDIKKALGEFKDQKEKAFFEGMSKTFQPIEKPEPGDWLWSQKQKPQPFQNYKMPYVNMVTPDKRTIYLLPFGKFNDKFMNKLVSFCGLFYPGTLVKVLPEQDLLERVPNITHRKNIYGDQFLCSDILSYMRKQCVPKDAYCVMGITLKDIYPGANWNYVYGWATYTSRVGIFSFVRWDTDFAQGNTPEINWQEILYPSIRTMVHEIGHMFAVLHCVYYRCLMNGYNNIQENYGKPLEFCAICFRKLHSNLKFNRAERYTNLIKYCNELKNQMLKGDIGFYQQMLALSLSTVDKSVKNTAVQNIQGHGARNKPVVNKRGASMPAVRRR